MISLRVLKTTDAGEEWYYNTVTGEKLPINSGQGTLEKHLCLATQEKEAILHTLMRNRGVLSLTIIPTWECNLRCTHCSVTTMLKTTDGGEINTNSFIKFVDDYLKEYDPSYMSVHFVGGEPLLRSDKCLEITKALYSRLEGTGINCMISLTTNATLVFNDTIEELFELLDKINISVDGDQLQHNLQRRALQKVDDPYSRTIENIRWVISKGFEDKLHIKAALRDEFYTADNYERFLKEMTALGVDVDNILFGCVHPTDLKHDKDKLESYSKIFGAKPMLTPCCKYRLNNVWLIDSSNNVYDLPYKWAQSKLGVLGEDLREMVNRRKAIILNSFPCFSDAKCMKCPVLGFCWGQCVSGNPLVDNKPSEFCHQDELIAHVDELRATGKLLEYVRFQSTESVIERHSV